MTALSWLSYFVYSSRVLLTIKFLVSCDQIFVDSIPQDDEHISSTTKLDCDPSCLMFPIYPTCSFMDSASSDMAVSIRATRYLAISRYCAERSTDFTHNYSGNPYLHSSSHGQQTSFLYQHNNAKLLWEFSVDLFFPWLHKHSPKFWAIRFLYRMDL